MLAMKRRPKNGADLKSRGIRNPRRWRIAVAIAAGALAAVTARPVFAQSPANVAVVINEASPASERIGLYYAEKRGLPEENIIRIRTSTDEAINRAVYAATIEQPIAQAIARQGLQDRVLYLVLTKGVPLRIAGTTGTTGTMSSVDSELTLLYRRMTGRTAAVSGFVVNPYYLGDRPVRDAKPFSHREHDIYLVTRLDAFTIAEALALVNRALNPAPQGQIVLDQRVDAKAGVGDGWLAEAARRITESGQGARVTLDESSWPIRNVEGVLGYYSWGSNDNWNQVRDIKIGFAPGALAAMLVGADGRTFELPPENWMPSADWNNRGKHFAGTPQSLIADLIRQGATGVAGNVAEPLMASTLRPQILFPAYLAGFNLVESFYLALPHLSWHSVIVGDPLCRPVAREPLATAALEDPIDKATNLPGLFSKRRMEVAQAALRGAPPRAVALTVLAEGHIARGDKAAARAALQEATVSAPDQVGPLLQLALLDEEAADLDSAIRRYRRVLELQPRNAVALNNLAYRLAVDKGQIAEALPFARRAVSLNPGNPSMLDTLAWIEHLMGNHAEAARLFTTALARGSLTAEIHLHAAIVYAANGARAAAEKQLAEAVRLDPAIAESDDARKLKARLAAR